MTTTTPPHLNRLAQSKSPYLLQHATNPVDWYEWGEEAFAKARDEDKPIFLSVGYSACHWCHVLAHESFENEEIGRFLSDNFVCVKVDREERPDVDRLYMTFIQATVGRGGWPMSVFLTPSLHPFFGGTYFPPDKFFSLLQRITQLWKADADDMRESGENVMRQLQEISKGSAVGSSTAFEVKAVSEKVVAHWSQSFDVKYGGFGAAPKFPSPAMTFYPLARHVYYARESSPESAKKALEMASFTLRKINDGGIHDQVGGGFSRYSVDNKWLVPHFEKMLYDQAQLLSSSLSTSLLLPPSDARTELESMSADVISYLAHDLANPGGGFYSAEDADSLEVEGGVLKKEGAFYVWEKSELREILGSHVEVFSTHFGVKLSGNVPSQHDVQGELVGKNVLSRQHSIEETAKLHHLAPDAVQSIIDRSLSKLKVYRDAHRPRPHLDDKVLTSWNALLISALSLASTSHPSAAIRQKSLEMALGTVAFLRANLWDSKTKTLLRSWRDGPGPRGMSDDYAFLVQGMLDLYEANGREEDLLFARELQARQDELFLDTENGGHFCSPADDPFILVRLKDSQDGAEPSASGVALSNLYRLGAYFDDPTYAENAKGVLRASGELLGRAPYAVGTTVGAMWLGRRMKQLIVVGDRKEVKTQELLERIYARWIPNRLLVHVDPQALPKKLADGNEVVKALIAGGDWTPSVRVCEAGVCGMPIESVEELEKELARV